jgi:COP9 signalosome complex subunit 2
MKLEFIILNIQYLNKVNNIDACESLYFEADKLNKEKTIKDNNINGIISEEGGKYNFRLERYSIALENFKDAYKSYEDSGNPRKNKILKMINLCYILQRNQENFIDTEEAKKFPNDTCLNLIIELKEYYEKIEIKNINILIEKIKKEENDFIIKDNIDDIIRNIRINYLIKKFKIFKRISIGYLEKEMQLNQNILYGLLNILYENKLVNVNNFLIYFLYLFSLKLIILKIIWKLFIQKMI